VQLGLLLNASSFPQIIVSTEIIEQLRGLRDCNWINFSEFDVLTKAYTQLTEARQRAALVDENGYTDAAPLLDIARALCKRILG
jgi:hypothetical protein